MSIFINGWTKKTFLKAIEERNGWVQATNTDDRCMYRTETDGVKRACMVGVFLPDELYSDDFEGTSLGCMIEADNEIANCMPLSSDLMSILQRRHDRYVMRDNGPFKPYMMTLINNLIKGNNHEQN